ncbi:MAG TPA: branched-chain amino acid ABC transporter permease [Actinomycetota bacterium]|jgi:branched-chain amino acid transport system permease protein
MSAAPAGQTELTTGSAGVRVTRSRRSVRWAAIVGIVVVVVLAALPYIVYSGTTSTLTNFFILLTLASMWNLLAGYAGLVSIGQQAFIGFGAYIVLFLGLHSVNPFTSIPLAALGCAVLSLPVWLLVFRLRGGYFAIATWVVADTCELLVSRSHTLGGGTGAGVAGFAGVDPTLLTAYTYWASLAVTVIALAGVYLVLRSRLGLVLTAVRDNEIGARSAGARVSRAKRTVFLAAAAGCGAAGALLAVSQRFVQPGSVFSVQWSAEMIFVTVIGGIGSIEGPIIGTIVFFVLQQTLSQYGAWYLIILGSVAIVVAIWAPRGLWGLVERRLNLRLFPVGFYLWPRPKAQETDSA